MLMGADTSGPSSATLSATVSRQTYRLPSAPLSERKVPRSTRFLIADSETPKAAAACRNVSLVSVTVYAPPPRPYALPFGDHAQALRSHPRTSGGDRNPGGLCRQHNLGRLLPPGPPNTNPPRHPPHSLEPSSWLCHAK